MRSTDLRGTVQVEAALTHFVVFDGAMEALVKVGNATTSSFAEPERIFQRKR